MLEECFAQWATRHFGLALQLARSTAESCLNRPGIQELSSSGAKTSTALKTSQNISKHLGETRSEERKTSSSTPFGMTSLACKTSKVTISMQSFRRGMPLLPAFPEDPSALGIDFQPGEGGHPNRRWGGLWLGPLGALRARQVPSLPVFESLHAALGLSGGDLQQLGWPEVGALHVRGAPRSMGSGPVPPLACEISTLWLPQGFLEAYPLQKTAYRRANGGSGAPGMHEEVVPKFATLDANDLEERPY